MSVGRKAQNPDKGWDFGLDWGMEKPKPSEIARATVMVTEWAFAMEIGWLRVIG